MNPVRFSVTQKPTSHARHKPLLVGIPALVFFLAPVHVLCIWLGVVRPALLTEEVLQGNVALVVDRSISLDTSTYCSP